MNASQAGEAAFKHQEVAFSVCMAAVAVLVRDNPAYSPHLLWGFAGLLTFNLLYHWLLRTKGESWYIPMISMAANTVLVTLLLHLSGGSDSPFWPMYLIPLFTACLYLDMRHVWFATASSTAFLGALYLLAADPDTPFLYSAAELTIKAAVLAVSAGVTARHAFSERHARVELSSARGELERLAADMERAHRDRTEKTDSMARVIAGLVYDLNGRLMLIRGRTELLVSELPEDSPQAQDAKGIADAARALGRFGSDLLRVLKRDENDNESVEVRPLVEQVVTLVEYRLRPRRLSLELSIPPGLHPARVGAAHLQQVLLELLDIATGTSRLEGTIAVRAESRANGDVEVHIHWEKAEEGAPPPPVPQRRLLESFNGSIDAFCTGRACEYVVHLPLGTRSKRSASR